MYDGGTRMEETVATSRGPRPRASTARVGLRSSLATSTPLLAPSSRSQRREELLADARNSPTTGSQDLHLHKLPTCMQLHTTYGHAAANEGLKAHHLCGDIMEASNVLIMRAAIKVAAGHIPLWATCPCGREKRRAGGGHYGRWTSTHDQLETNIHPHAPCNIDKEASDRLHFVGERSLCGRGIIEAYG
ncbi:hypothetical protein Dimus_022141 [Dionaea muscipula]